MTEEVDVRAVSTPWPALAALGAVVVLSLTMFVLDMTQPGVEVRPLRQINGASGFTEVFLNDARVSDADRIGELGEGWKVAMSTLSFERGTAFTIQQVQLSSTVERLIVLARERTDGRGRPLMADDEIAHSLARARVDVTALRALT